MSGEPKLSIGIPVYNGERFIAELLANLQAQTFKDFEIIICDNASEDRTQAISEAYARKDPRIRYYRSDVNVGAGGNFDRAFNLSRAELFKWAACDDLLQPTYLEKCVQVLEDNQDVIGVHSLPVYVDAQCRPFAFDPDSAHYADSSTGIRLLVDPPIAESRFAGLRFIDVLFNSRIGLTIFSVFRRNALERTRGLRTNFYLADKALLLEMALLGRSAYVEGNLFIKRFHRDSSTALSDEERERWFDPAGGNYSRLVRQFLGYITTPIGKPVGAFTKLACFSIVCIFALKFLLVAGLGGIGLLRMHRPSDAVRVAMRGAN